MDRFLLPILTTLATLALGVSAPVASAAIDAVPEVPRPAADELPPGERPPGEPPKVRQEPPGERPPGAPGERPQPPRDGRRFREEPGRPPGQGEEKAEGQGAQGSQGPGPGPGARRNRPGQFGEQGEPGQGERNRPFPEGQRPFRRDLPRDLPFDDARENARRNLDKMTPEQRQEFWRNFQKWMQMPPEDKQALVDRSETRRKKVREEIEKDLTEIGIAPGEEEKRKQFMQRYFQERKAIENQLRKEMEERRKPMLEALKNKLKAEFAAEAKPAEPKPDEAKPEDKPAEVK